MKLVLNNLGPPVIYTPGRWKSSDRPDVVLVPGFMLGDAAMGWLAEHLTTEGLACAIPRTKGFMGFLQTRSIQVAGGRVARFLEQLPDGCRPWLVGHSLGGLICRYAIQELGAADRIAGLITLGTPHRGTPAAYAGLAIGTGAFSWSIWQLRPQSSMVRHLNLKPWPEHLPLAAVTSPADLLCQPPRSEPPFQNGANVRVSEFAGIGHTELLWHRDILDFVTHTVRRQEASQNLTS